MQNLSLILLTIANPFYNTRWRNVAIEEFAYYSQDLITWPRINSRCSYFVFLYLPRCVPFFSSKFPFLFFIFPYKFKKQNIFSLNFIFLIKFLNISWTLSMDLYIIQGLHSFNLHVFTKDGILEYYFSNYLFEFK